MACYSRWVPAGSSSARPVRCGKCIGCRLDYSRQWAVRIMHEASLHEQNSFVTLTYKENPIDLLYGDYQLFMRRLRKARGYARFFCAGEYGEDRGRPHFHAVLFGVGFHDGKSLGKSEAGFRVFSSDALSALWPHGYSSFGGVTFESAAYVARYVVKKVDGVQHLTGWHPYTRIGADGYEMEVRPEFAKMSLKPGIGAKWLDKYWSDVWPAGQIVSRGFVCGAPRYYRKKFADRCPDVAKELSMDAMEESLGRIEENAPSRLDAKEAVKVAQLGMLKRVI